MDLFILGADSSDEMDEISEEIYNSSAGQRVYIDEKKKIWQSFDTCSMFNTGIVRILSTYFYKCRLFYVLIYMGFTKCVNYDRKSIR